MLKNSLISILYLVSGGQSRFFHTCCVDFTSIAATVQTQQLITSQMRSHTEYLIQTYDILVLILYATRLGRTSGFLEQMTILDIPAYFLGHHVSLAN